MNNALLGLVRQFLGSKYAILVNRAIIKIQLEEEIALSAHQGISLLALGTQTVSKLTAEVMLKAFMYVLGNVHPAILQILEDSIVARFVLSCFGSLNSDGYCFSVQPCPNGMVSQGFGSTSCTPAPEGAVASKCASGGTGCESFVTCPPGFYASKSQQQVCSRKISEVHSSLYL